MPNLTLNEVQNGMRFKATSPVFRGDNVEFPTGSLFNVVDVIGKFIKLRCVEEGRFVAVLPTSRPEGQPEDYFHYVSVNLETLNTQLVQLEDDE